MKVIAHAGRETVLVELTRTELARVAGHHCESSVPHNGFTHERFPIGETIDVSAMYDRLQAQRNVASQLSQMAKNLRGLADLVDVVQPSAELLTKVPEISAIS